LEEPEETEKHWEDLRSALGTAEKLEISSLFDSLSQSEKSLAASRLNSDELEQLFSRLDPSLAASFVESVHATQAADIMEALPAKDAAAIVDEMYSDRQADILSELTSADAEAILDEMMPAEAKAARALMAYPPDSVGSLMVSEFLAYPQSLTISDVLEDLQKNREKYASFHVLYIYVVDSRKKLVGVLKMHDLLFAPRAAQIKKVMICDPIHLNVEDTIEELREFFKTRKFLGMPVTDKKGCLVGVVLPRVIDEVTQQESVNQFLGLSGIVGGEEFRSMPLINRSGRRLSWLSINIVLNIIAAGVIAYYQETLISVIALAVFLPMISDMSGCSGNQAVAVTMRELNLGMVRQGEILRVLTKEMSLGIINGIALGILLGSIALLWKGNPWLGLVVGGALAANTIVAVSLGGVLPLLLKRMKLDPALVASPILTTVTDMCGFFFVLGFATFILPRLV